MKLGAFITITRPEERGDLYKECIYQANQFCDKVTVINGEQSWPREFSWETISNHFQAGYKTTETDWVLHLDTDFIIHENDFEKIRDSIEMYEEAPALSLYKYQFILPDRYNLKSRLVALVNKRVYGDRIKFNGSGDVCQPTLDGDYIAPGMVPESGAAIFNYEKVIKTKNQIKDDTGRMARAWQRYFGDYKLGGPDDDNAYLRWIEMQIGRFNKPQKEVPINFHPEVMRPVILDLTKEQWGYSGFGLLERNNYCRIKQKG